VLAVPGDIERATSRGCHALLRSGAGVCEGVADVRAALAGAVPRAGALEAPRADSRPGAPRERAPSPERASPSAAEKAGDSTARLLEGLAGRPATVEDCARAAGLPVPETLERLLRLEWAGLVRPAPGGRWIRREDRA
jgi:DNA processing protein